MDYDKVDLHEDAARRQPTYPVSKNVRVMVVEGDSQCCGCCVYWRQFSPYDTSDYVGKGECLAEPPTFGHPNSPQAANWPVTYAQRWCGRFRPVEYLKVVKD